MTIPVIHDGDHGGDDFITSLLLISFDEIFGLKGITTTCGNTNSHQAALNALRAISLSGRDNIPVFQGKDKPFLIDYRLGDDAFGGDGIGNIDFPLPKNMKVNGTDAVSWIAETLNASADPITVCVTGPMTNMASLITRFPEVKSKISEIVAMGGGTNPSGNIKPYAEFNFYMDPDAADIVLNSGVKIVLHSLNTTQKVIYTKERQEILRSTIQSEFTDKIDSVMRITEELEKKSFGVDGAFFHDHQTCAFLAMRDNYELEHVRARVLNDKTSEPGKLLIERDDNSPVQIVTEVKSTDKVFSFVLEGLKRILHISK